MLRVNVSLGEADLVGPGDGLLVTDGVALVDSECEKVGDNEKDGDKLLEKF